MKKKFPLPLHFINLFVPRSSLFRGSGAQEFRRCGPQRMLSFWNLNGTGGSSNFILAQISPHSSITSRTYRRVPFEFHCFCASNSFLSVFVLIGHVRRARKEKSSLAKHLINRSLDGNAIRNHSAALSSEFQVTVAP